MQRGQRFLGVSSEGMARGLCDTFKEEVSNQTLTHTHTLPLHTETDTHSHSHSLPHTHPTPSHWHSLSRSTHSHTGTGMWSAIRRKCVSWVKCSKRRGSCCLLVCTVYLILVCLTGSGSRCGVVTITCQHFRAWDGRRWKNCIQSLKV